MLWKCVLRFVKEPLLKHFVHPPELWAVVVYFYFNCLQGSVHCSQVWIWLTNASLARLVTLERSLEIGSPPPPPELMVAVLRHIQTSRRNQASQQQEPIFSSSSEWGRLNKINLLPELSDMKWSVSRFEVVEEKMIMLPVSWGFSMDLMILLSQIRTSLNIEIVQNGGV